jgi:hypothetical protein
MGENRSVQKTPRESYRDQENAKDDLEAAEEAESSIYDQLAWISHTSLG